LAKWCSIKVNVRFLLINSLRYIAFYSVRAVSGRPLSGFRSVADHAHQPVYRLLSLSKPTLSTLFRKYYNNCFRNVRNVSIRALSSYDILPITKVIGLTAIMTWNIEAFRAYYNAMLHVNIKIMTSQQRWYLLLNYFNNNNNNNNNIKFLFSCESRSWSLRFRQVNTTQSNTLVHSIVPNKWATFGAKIFRHFWDIAIFVLGYFIFPHPV